MREPLNQSSPTPWFRLLRFFHAEGKLGGLRYSAQVRVLEITAETSPVAADILPRVIEPPAQLPPVPHDP